MTMTTLAFEVQNATGKRKLKLTLDDEILSVEDASGKQNRRIPLRQIASMRLNYGPASEYAEAHYVCSLKEQSGQVFRFRADTNEAQALSDYKRLVEVLHAELGKMPQPPRFFAGMASGFWFWVIFVWLLLMFVGLEALAVWGIFGDRKPGLAAIFALVLPLLAYWLLRLYHRLASPRSYDPQDTPRHLMP